MKNLIIFCVCVLFSKHVLSSVIKVDLSLYQPISNKSNVLNKVYNLTDTENKLQIINIGRNVDFLVVQVHSFIHNVSLSQIYSEQKTPSVTGSDIGLVYRGSNSESVTYALNKHTPNNTKVLIAVHLYDITAPLPGGCSLTFDNELAPYQMVSFTRDLITVDSQPPSLNGVSCDDNEIKTEMYFMYLEEHSIDENEYFDGITKMLTVDGIRKNGKLATSNFKQSVYRRLYSAYWGIGEIFAVIATYGNKSSTYVPVVSYACNISRWTEDCIEFYPLYWKIFMPLLLIAGKLLNFTGCALGLVVILNCGIIFMILDSFNILTDGAATYFEVIILLIFVPLCVWMMISHKEIWSGISMLLVFSTGTILFSSSMYYAQISGSLFGTYFWILLIICIFSACTPLAVHLYRIMASFTGSFMIMVAMSYYAFYSNLYFIPINFYRYAAVDDFSYAKKTPPFQNKDAYDIMIWVLHQIVGCIIQYMKKKAVDKAFGKNEER